MQELTDADRNQLTAMVEDEWLTAVIDKDPEAASRLCSADFVYMPQDHPRLVGHREVTEFLKGFPAVIRGRQGLEHASGSSALAVLWGTIDATLQVDGIERSGRGKFLATASRTTGTWLFTTACFNWDGPLS